MPDTLIVFVPVQLIERSDLGFRCRVGDRIVWIGSLQCPEGTTVHIYGDKLVLRAEDAATLGLTHAKPVPR
jgi:hypothetical protein